MRLNIRSVFSPIVVVPKKNGKLRVCIDLKKVNAAICRDHYPLPFSEHVLERVAGKEAYSFLDGYSGYNQISIAEEDQPITSFITEYEVFAFKRMPFSLTNAPATFQRLMNHAFKEFMDLPLTLTPDPNSTRLGAERCLAATLSMYFNPYYMTNMHMCTVTYNDDVYYGVFSTMGEFQR